jgi:hypothetical protein
LEAAVARNRRELLSRNRKAVSQFMNEDLTPTGSSAIASHSTGISEGSPGLHQSTEQVKQSAQAEFQKLKGAAHEHTAAAVEQMKEKAQDASQQAKEMSSTFFKGQKQNVVSRVDAYAESARKAAECLRSSEGHAVAGAVSTAAEQLTRVSDYLRQKEPTDLLHDVEQFARRKPEIVFGGMFLLGLAASRFLKASSPRQQSGARYGADQYGPESVPSYVSRTTAPDVPLTEGVGSRSVEEPFAPVGSAARSTTAPSSSVIPPV